MITAPGQPTLTVAAPVSVSRYTVSLMEQPGELVGRALVVVVDDRTAHGEEDHSGPLVTELLNEAGFVVDGVVVVSADEVEIRNALNTAVIGGVDLVVSVGGTGVTPRDVTPRSYPRHPGSRTARHRRGAARVRARCRRRRCRTVSRPGRNLRQHAGGEHRWIPIRGTRRDGDSQPVGHADHRPAIQLGDLTNHGCGAI